LVHGKLLSTTGFNKKTRITSDMWIIKCTQLNASSYTSLIIQTSIMWSQLYCLRIITNRWLGEMTFNTVCLCLQDRWCAFVVFVVRGFENDIHSHARIARLNQMTLYTIHNSQLWKRTLCSKLIIHTYTMSKYRYDIILKTNPWYIVYFDVEISTVL